MGVLEGSRQGVGVECCPGCAHRGVCVGVQWGCAQCARGGRVCACSWAGAQGCSGVLPVRHRCVWGVCSGLSVRWKVCSVCTVRVCACRDGGVGVVCATWERC